ncbi:MAG TPA: inositol monophosphatase family protein [Gemmatimonadaceae bacterium]|jgi:histidinol phosphatase-like enzyme (inositol monophosphatase family)|nr:inositol monophosphatase family protein [Gemmatimonadaceae bacterium]
MKSESQDSLLQAARECADLAGAFAHRHYRAGVAIEWKEDGSPVTLADRGAEQLARDWIAARFPDDGIVGEEFGDKEGTSGRRWILDPIDGTKSFVRGVPLWGSLVAVLEGETVLAGAASFPATGETIAAAKGCGCWHNGLRAAVSNVAAIGDATVLTSDDTIFAPGARRSAWDRFSRMAAVSRMWGDAFGYLLVATGRADVMVDAIVNAWDIACFVPIIEEAGGAFTDYTGRVTAFGGNSIATNAALATESRRILCSI